MLIRTGRFGVEHFATYVVMIKVELLFIQNIIPFSIGTNLTANSL